MDEKKIAHLQMIQGIISRMAGNSFLLRGWTVTLVAALFALAAKDAERRYVLIAYLPSVMFWILDAYYLAQEGRYRDLYAEVSAKAEADVDFSMDASEFDRPWSKALLSLTNLVFYGFIIGIVLLVMFGFPWAGARNG
jgi:hypothetical protein